ncbi:EamA family transporter [Acidobacterium sp. S8]|uniref:EamA family transporter n=1 Tax=Acidobacterium sp. S8 TaxID=1641854 RepID=UPI00131C8A87|nr:EamA family transporter [Acidobacterium sp. S8]
MNELHHSGLTNAAMIACIVAAATIGDVMIASAMRQIGDLDDIKAHAGLLGAIKAVITNTRFFCGVAAMAVSFFSLLFALSHADLSLVAPASASLTVVTNTIAGKVFLKENVDRRRWLAALCVCFGVALLAR